jgi:hypothetical protein
MEGENLVELYSSDEFHPKIVESFFSKPYFFLHVRESYSNLLFYFLLRITQKNLPVIDVRVHLQS